MVKTYINTQGNIVADPTDLRGRHERWLTKITDSQNNVRYDLFKEVSPKASELITQYVLDLDAGKNLAKGVKKGKRSYAYLVGARTRLPRLCKQMEVIIGKELIVFTEDDVLQFFSDMRDGKILNYRNQRYVGIRNQSKVFCSFWHWVMRFEKKNGNNLLDIVYSVDNSSTEKPKWVSFTLKDVEHMADEASSYYYRTLVYFLFDSGIRAPRELMNVRAMDITPVPDSNHLFLDIRQDTSKTFGRKIKLMICSDVLRKYIKYNNLKGEDFLFTRGYTSMSRTVAKLGYRAMGIGKLFKDSPKKTRVSGGISMYDFRHNSVCYYLPIYKSENQLKYRYGWKKADMIDYYSERIGMRDTVSEKDMQGEKQSDQGALVLIAELLKSQRSEFERRMVSFEERLIKQN